MADGGRACEWKERSGRRLRGTEGARVRRSPRLAPWGRGTGAPGVTRTGRPAWKQRPQCCLTPHPTEGDQGWPRSGCGRRGENAGQAGRCPDAEGRQGVGRSSKGSVCHRPCALVRPECPWPSTHPATCRVPHESHRSGAGVGRLRGFPRGSPRPTDGGGSVFSRPHGDKLLRKESQFSCRRSRQWPGSDGGPARRPLAPLVQWYFHNWLQSVSPRTVPLPSAACLRLVRVLVSILFLHAFT